MNEETRELVFLYIRVMRKKTLNPVLFALALSALLVACGETKVDAKAEGKKLEELYRAWAKSKSNQEYLSYWDKNALVIPPGEGSMRGHDEIMKMLEESANIPGFMIDWEPKEVKVSASGDMAYIVADSYVALNDSTGAQMKFFSKTVTIWEKDAEGNWKNTVDIWNDDPTMKSIR